MVTPLQFGERLNEAFWSLETESDILVVNPEPEIGSQSISVNSLKQPFRAG